MLESALSCPRCGCPLFPNSGCTPGVLILGMTEWSAPYFKFYDKEVNQTQTSCVNVSPKIGGVFAVVFNAEVLPSLILWIQLQNSFALDWMFTFLSIEGFVVRAMRHPIATANFRHNSFVQMKVMTQL